MAYLSRPFSFDEYTLIVEHVAEKWQSRPTLKALCLTQRSLVHLCQKHIFSSFTCSPPKLDTFLDIVRTSPHLFDYIRDFSYEMDDSKHPTAVKKRRNKNTIQLFERLHDLRSLSVSALKPWEGVYWEDINHRVSSALLCLILSPSLRSLHLSKILNFPPTGLLGLRNSRHLETISLGCVELNPHDYTDAVESINIDELLNSDSPPQPLTFRAHENSGQAVMSIVGLYLDKLPLSLDHPLVFNFTKLRNIYAESGGDVDSIANFLLITSASQLDDLLYVLTKGSDATFRGVGAAIFLGPFQTLRDLKLYTNEPDGDEDDLFLGSIQELRQLAGGKMKCLEIIRLCFNMFSSKANNGPKLRRLCRAIKTECKSIDGIFADRNAFPVLHTISIDFILMIYATELGFGNPDLEREFSTVRLSQQIGQKSFKNLNAIPSINNSFHLEMIWEG